MVSALTRTEKSMGIAAGASIRCWPMTAPASAAAVWSMMVTIATAAGVSAICSSYDNDPVTDVFAAATGNAKEAPRSATVAAKKANRRKSGTDGRHGGPQRWGPGTQPPHPPPVRSLAGTDRRRCGGRQRGVSQVTGRRSSADTTRIVPRRTSIPIEPLHRADLVANEQARDGEPRIADAQRALADRRSGDRRFRRRRDRRRSGSTPTRPGTAAVANSVPRPPVLSIVGTGENGSIAGKDDRRRLAARSAASVDHVQLRLRARAGRWPPLDVAVGIDRAGSGHRQGRERRTRPDRGAVG